MKRRGVPIPRRLLGRIQSYLGRRSRLQKKTSMEASDPPDPVVPAPTAVFTSGGYWANEWPM